MKDRLLPTLESLLPEGLDLLRQMVAINSFTSNAAGVDALGGLTASAFAGLGFSAESVPSVHPLYGRHLFLRRSGAGPRVLLVTHLDTVFPPEEELRENFRWAPAPEERRIYGPGTVDIKGGTLVIWLALQALARLAPSVLEQADWMIAANSSEEALSDDFAARTAERCPAGAAAVLVYEGGAVRQDHLTLVPARKGKADYRLEVSGRGAHAGSFHAEGRNAIVALAEAVQRAAALTDYSQSLTVNVGRIEGGTVVNRVPHRAVAELEMRAFDPRVFADARGRIEALAGASAVVPDARLSVSCIGDTPPWSGDGATMDLFDHFGATAAELGLRVQAERRGGLSDANYLHPLGPTLDGLGPSGGNAHCSERSPDGLKVPEFVEVDSFVPKAALTALALSRAAGIGWQFSPGRSAS